MDLISSRPPPRFVGCLINFQTKLSLEDHWSSNIILFHSFLFHFGLVPEVWLCQKHILDSNRQNTLHITLDLTLWISSLVGWTWTGGRWPSCWAVAESSPSRCQWQQYSYAVVRSHQNAAEAGKDGQILKLTQKGMLLILSLDIACRLNIQSATMSVYFHFHSDKHSINLWKQSLFLSFFIIFNQFICCLSAVLWLVKGDFPENFQTVCQC